jgi:DNA polymerase I-like protein with 3'-5' exonuclease and polymerase domains
MDIIVPASDWQAPTELPDLVALGVRRMAVDTETRDDGLAAGRGPGWPYGVGYVAGVSAAWDGGALYVPIRHPDTACMPRETVAAWLRHHFQSSIEIIFQNAPYDIGWLWQDLGLEPPARLHDTQGMAATVDENRLTYNLDDLCKWMGIPGKDDRLLREAALAYGAKSGKDRDVKSFIWRLPARFSAPYAEQDGRATLQLYDRLQARLVQENMLEAYQLEADLVPMVHHMRRRGVRVDTDQALETQERLFKERDLALARLTDRVSIGRDLTINDVNSPRTLAALFDAEGIKYDLTAKSKQASFQSDWLEEIDHWLPRDVLRARQMHMAADKFIGGFILDYTHKGRIHAEVHQYRSDEGGTRSFRFSYSDPPLQQMTRPEPDKVNPEHKDYVEGFVDIGTLVRGCFLPEEGEIWDSTDYSQQEYRLIVHFASVCKIASAEKAVAKYNADPKTDFHNLVAEMTGLSRKPAKDTNFAKAFGAGVGKFAAMTGKSYDEAKAIMEQYDTEMPFVKGLAEHCESRAQRRGFIRLIDGARSHFDMWEASWYKGPFHPSCSREEAIRRINDPDHDWHGHQIRRANTHKAMNRLIQGSAARQTKLAMRECWRQGLLPLLQMHDELCFSITTPQEARTVEEIMKTVVPLVVPMRVDVELGPNWGLAKKSIEEMFGANA